MINQISTRVIILKHVIVNITTHKLVGSMINRISIHAIILIHVKLYVNILGVFKRDRNIC